MMSETGWDGLYLGVVLSWLYRAYDVTTLSFIYRRWNKHIRFSGGM
jgi:hypothetical protein